MKKILFFILLTYAVGASRSGQASSAVVSGGGSVSTGEFQLTATIGQAAVVASASSAEEMLPGFWPVVNTNLSPVVLYNSASFGVTTVLGKELPFTLIISNGGSYPLEYEIGTDATWENFEWLTVSRVSGVVPGSRSDTITVTVVGTANLGEGSCEGRLLVTTNTGVGLNPVTDSVWVSLTVLPETGGIVSGNAAVPAGDAPPVRLTDDQGNSLGVTIDFSSGEGGTVTATSVSSTPPSDSTTGFYDPDSLVRNPVYSDFYWEISSTVPEGFAADITFDYASQAGIPNPDQLRLARRMNYAGPGIGWKFLAADSVKLNEADRTITARSQSGFSQWTVASEKTHNTFQDIQAPLISEPTVTPESPKVQEPVTVSATVTDESDIESVNLYYLQGGDPGFRVVPMTENGGAFSAVIPDSHVTMTGIAYVIRAVDMFHRTRNGDTLTVDVSFSAGGLSTAMDGSPFPDGIPRNRWRLISVPAELDEPGVVGLFGEKLKGEPTITTWRIFEWKGSQWVDVNDVRVGEAYWLYQMVKKDVVIEAGSGRSVDLTGTRLTLQPGWNLIGSPYAFVVDVAVDQTQFYGPLTYGGPDVVGKEGWSGIVTELLPWGGYAIYNRGSSPQTLDIEPLKSTGNLEMPLKGWTLRLAAKGERYSDVANYIGRAVGAREELDYFENPEPPYIDGYISLAMDRREWGSDLPRFTSDIRSTEETNGIWDISLYVKGETGAISLSHELSGTLPSGLQIVLLDLVTSDVHSLADGSDEIMITGYIPAGRSKGEALPYPFKVIAGSPDYVSRTVKEVLALLPGKVALFQNYPNPFNPVTRIRYALPKPQLVTLKVYNLLGQEVVTLVYDWKVGGHHDVIWDGKDRYGLSVSSGIYFSTLFAGNRVLSRKMVIIR